MEKPSAIYLAEAELAGTWPVQVLGAGTAITAPGAAYPAHGHPASYQFDWRRGRVLEEYQVLLITRGGGRLEMADEAVFELKAPCLFVVFPGHWHRYRPDPETGWQEHWIAFKGAFAEELQTTGALDPTTPVFHTGHSEMLLSQFQLVQDEARAEALGFRAICASSIMQILALATHLPQRSKEERQPMRDVIRRACFLMRERSDRPLLAEDLASEMGIGYTYFRRMFRNYTGISPKRYHDQLRLQRAKRLLRDSTASISQIADRLGFNSPFHFSNWFKQQVGNAPQNWRKDPTASFADAAP